MEGPPLWVWAIVVGTIIAGKFIYRWKLTNELSKDTKYSDQSFNKVKGDWTPIKKVGYLITNTTPRILALADLKTI